MEDLELNEGRLKISQYQGFVELKIPNQNKWLNDETALLSRDSAEKLYKYLQTFLSNSESVSSDQG